MLSVPVLVAQFAGSLDLVDSSRIGVRATQPLPVVPQGQIAVASDVSTAGGILTRVHNRRWDFALGYSASVTAGDVELGVHPIFMQAANASVGWHGRFVRWTVSESVSYGQVSTLIPYQQATVPNAPSTAGQPTMPAQGTMPGQPTTSPGQPGQTTTPGQTPGPPQTTLLNGTRTDTFSVVSSDTSAGLGLPLGRRATFSASVGYGRTGALNGDGEAYLPTQYAMRAGMGLFYVLSRADVLGTTASVADTITPSGQCLPGETNGPTCRTETPVAGLSASYTHRLSVRSSLSVNAGAAASVALSSSQPPARELVIVPTGGASYTEVLEGARTLTLSVQVSPMVDMRTGDFSNRVSASAVVSQRLAPGVTGSATASVLQSIDFPTIDPNPITAVNGGVVLAVRLTRLLDLSMGATVLWQVQTSFAPALFSEAGFVGVTAHAPTLHF
jgi:hypothetical protein